MQNEPATVTPSSDPKAFEPKLPAVIFDMDGTLCDVTSVRHHVLDRRRKNHHAFHYGSLWCPPIPWVLDNAHRYHRAGFHVIVVTAREEKWRELTSNWLESVGAPPYRMFMRPTGDFRKDKLIKGEILDMLLETYDIHHAYDDNPAILELWQERGVPYTVVPGWAEEF
jgi:phosphoglycolate phosphatase-like HAD superfamily hydrolase